MPVVLLVRLSAGLRKKGKEEVRKSNQAKKIPNRRQKKNWRLTRKRPASGPGTASW
jgi:hypothetical protein